MKQRWLPSVIILQACATAPAAQSPSQAVAASVPRFDAAGELLPPTDYRSWVFLTSGFSMAYGPAAEVAAESGVQVLDNVFVGREPYERFLTTGRWPESTMFVLEVRSAEHTGSIVTVGHYQTDLAAVEVEVKDSARFPGGWGFFSFNITSNGPAGPAKLLTRDASCYGCHAQNAAVENTFTQFYPTLFAVARDKGTVRKDFVGIPPGAGELYDEIVAHGWEAARQRIDAAVAKWPAANIAREFTFDQIGHRLLEARRIAEGIAVLADATQRFPGSASAWDSLAEALEAANRRDEARQADARGLAALAADRAPASTRKVALERSMRERDARLAN
jgi:hypothetical protein